MNMGEDRVGIDDDPRVESSSGGGFVPENETVKKPVELKVGDVLKVKYGSVTGRVDMVLGRNPDTRDRTEFDKEPGAGLKVVLRDEEGQPIKTMSRRAVRARYSEGQWEFTDLKTGAKTLVGSESDLRNTSVDIAPVYKLRVGGLSGRSGAPGLQITSFILLKKEEGK